MSETLSAPRTRPELEARTVPDTRPVTVNEAGTDSLWTGLRELWQYRGVVIELVRRDLKLRYKNSIGGIAWSLFNPLMQILVLTLLLKYILVSAIKDGSAYLFVLFLWNFIVSTLGDCCVVLIGNGSLVRKTYFPRSVLPLAAVISNMFHFGVAFFFTIVYFFILGTYPSQLHPQFLIVIPVIFFSCVGCLGGGLILSYLNVFYEDVRFLMQALLQLMFYSLPILYTVEQVKARGFLDLYLLNPAAALLTTYQRALLPPPVVKDGAGNVLPSVYIPWAHFGLACVFCTLLFLGGMWFFERYKWEAVERL